MCVKEERERGSAALSQRPISILATNVYIRPRFPPAFYFFFSHFLFRPGSRARLFWSDQCYISEWRGGGGSLSLYLLLFYNRSTGPETNGTIKYIHREGPRIDTPRR
jgi:hypothetical protein